MNKDDLESLKYTHFNPTPEQKWHNLLIQIRDKIAFLEAQKIRIEQELCEYRQKLEIELSDKITEVTDKLQS
ncbi:hypothetical protein [Anabaena catenula]|uniref:Uncharacterized protein n=1 Tax=Anabaena catenula FACHB-362 TaxID=2692877 RepID=A0ABR8J2P4_9NOST|nr:hypothetical protein [Anabaena catenula]MBD2692633.1 hypothetical protein [Anabaena catenula FACHB-362]